MLLPTAQSWSPMLLQSESAAQAAAAADPLPGSSAHSCRCK
jgi:hypothetical protein